MAQSGLILTGNRGLRQDMRQDMAQLETRLREAISGRAKASWCRKLRRAKSIHLRPFPVQLRLSSFCPATRTGIFVSKT